MEPYGTYEDVTHRDTITAAERPDRSRPTRAVSRVAVTLFGFERLQTTDGGSCSTLGFHRDCAQDIYATTILRSCVHVVESGFVAGRGVCFQGWRIKHGEMFSAKQPVTIVAWCARSPDRTFRIFLEIPATVIENYD